MYEEILPKTNDISCFIHKRTYLCNKRISLKVGFKLGDSTSQEYVRYNVCGFDGLMRRSMFSLRQRTITSDNALVCSIVSSYFNDNSTIFAKWKKMLLTKSSYDLFFPFYFLFSFSLAAIWMYNCI